MDFIKGGKSKPGSVKKTGKDKEGSVRVQQIKGAEVDARELPTKIEVNPKGQVKALVPGSVFRQSSFKWDPQTFVLESDELNQKFIEPSMQDESLARFLKKPSTPMIYGVTGSPDDTKAKLFAAYLLQAHCKRYGGDANPWWVNLMGGFDNPWIDRDRPRPSMIVITNLTAGSTAQRLEKARDIIESWPDVPRVIVAAGLDPFSFLATRLRVPVHGLAYFSEAVVKHKVVVI